MIALPDIGYRSDIRLDADPLIIQPTSCLAVVDPHIRFQCVRAVAITWHSRVIST